MVVNTINKKLEISPLSLEIGSNFIFITGPARSGTKLLGSILASSKKSLYAHEPPFLASLYARKNILGSELLSQMISEYLYEEYALNLLAGRALNFNRKDYTFVYNFKSNEEVEDSILNSWNRDNLESEILSRNFIVKFPDISQLVDILKTHSYPSMKSIFITRDMFDVVKSMIRLGWYLPGKSKTNIPPYYSAINDSIPYWVDVKYHDWWLTANQEKRCIFAFNLHNKAPKDSFLINYNDLCLNPKKEVEDLFKFANLEQTEMTGRLIENIRPLKEKNRSEELAFTNKVSEINKEVLNLLAN